MASKTIIVTGANRGLGAALVAMLQASPEKYTIVATSRAAFQLPQGAPGANPVTRQELDVSSPSSITAFAKAIREQYGTIDVLVNNAGVSSIDKPDKETAKPTLDINLRGVMQLCDELAPLIKEGGRIVNVASNISLLFLQHASPAMKETFLAKGDKKLDLAAILKIADQFETAISNGTEQAEGFGDQRKMYGPYAISKALLCKATEVYAAKYPKLLINSCCPGWCSTDMGSNNGALQPPKTADDGARILYNAAVKDIGKVTGHYFAEPTAADKGEGKPAIWGTA